MHLVFDIETTGFPKSFKAPVSDLDNWPRMVQIAWLLFDTDGHEIAAHEQIIRPEGFVIPADATRIHGITTEMALEQGIPLPTVLDEVVADLEQASVLIAHNMSFDEKILGSELLRAGRPDLVAKKKRRCTMRGSTDHCKLPGRYGYKWPTLQELHTTLFDESFDEAHRALPDVRACARCYFELRRLGAMP